MRLFYIFLLPVFLVGCGSSKREVELESQLKKIETELANTRKKEEVQAQKEIEELKKQQSKIKINGTVFVKTKGGENFKLALIPIGVSTLEEYESACATVVDNINGAIKSNAPTVKSNKAKYLELNLKYKSALAAYEPIRLKDEAEMNRLEHFCLNSGGKYFMNQYRQRFSYFPPLGGSKTTAQKYADTLNSFRKKTIEHWKSCNLLYKELSGLKDNSYDIVSSIMRKMDRRVRNAIKILHNDTVQTRSDADGKFSLELDRKKDYVLTGYGERQAGGSTETYNWIVPLRISNEDKNIEVFFSNDELSTEIKEEIKIMSFLNPLPSPLPIRGVKGQDETDSDPLLWTIKDKI